MVNVDESAIRVCIAALGGHAGAVAERIPRQGMIAGDHTRAVAIPGNSTTSKG